MILELLNWIACVLTIWGTYEVSQKHPNTLKVNILYGIGSILLIIIFSIQINYSMLCMYIILLGFAIRGIINSQKGKQEDIRDRVMGNFHEPNIAQQYQEYLDQKQILEF